MKERLKNFFRKQLGITLLIGIFMGSLLFFGGKKAMEVTSTDAFCASCHVHPHSTDSWKRSTHYDNKRGIVVHCVDCHLPPHGWEYFTEKTKTGLRDVYGTLFKDTEKINWELKSTPEAAERHTYQESCVRCHQNLFPLGLSREGEEAHLYFDQQKEGEKVSCVRCHLNVGHYTEGAKHAHNLDFGKTNQQAKEIYTLPATLESFKSYTEYIPGSSVKFDMVAIPGGKFRMGSEENESFRKADEGPAGDVLVDSFFMGKAEVSWDEFMAFFSQASSGHGIDQAHGKVDAISGPTPPWGDPSQGWGRGSRPAITMSWHAAETYCKWLSQKTGKKYRLPTEAEWEYAARGGNNTPYFFPGEPEKYTARGFLKKILKPDTSIISRYAIYSLNSSGKTAEPGQVQPNPFGLLHMLGNVSEICSDWYAQDYSYRNGSSLAENPKGPAEGEEKVIRGGSYMSDAADIRSAAREKTQTVAWLKTDPQMPKSIWWYSDCRHVGFRIVCEYSKELTK